MTMIELTPALFKDERKKVQVFNNVGEWSARPIVELKNLSESIFIDREAPRWLELAGIPDMWARPLLFEEALFDESHILHSRVLGEWRGMLALLALKDVYNCPLDTQEVLIDESNSFSSALNKLKPKKFSYEGSDWSRIFVLNYHGKPIGMTSPTTLVCTAAQYEIVGNQIPWTNYAQLSDPVEKLNPRTRNLVANWIGKISTSLKGDSKARKTELLNSLLKVLDTFKDELGGSRGQISLGNRSLGLEGFYKYINRAVESDDTGVESAVQLKPTRVLGSVPTLLVVGQDIAKQWEMPSNQVIIYNNGVLEQLPVSGVADGTTFNGVPLPQTVRIKNADDFFTSKLYVITAKQALPGTLPMEGANMLQTDGSDVTPLLPLKPELLNYFEPHQLSKLILFEQHGNDITVTLKLPLTGPDGQGRIYRASRTYKKETGEIVTVENNPVVSVWPNFTRPDWRVYYSYFSKQKGSFYAEPFVTTGPLAHEHRRVLEQSEEGISREIVQMDSFPEAMICKVRNSEVGLLLLLKPPSYDQINQNDWTVGVDFGTTGTNIYCRSGSNKPRSLVFAATHYHHVTATGSAIGRLYEYFLPGERQEFPISSIFMRTQTAASSMVYKPLLDGKVFYLIGADDVFGHNRTNIRYDFKWGAAKNKDDSKITRAFLKQICLQTLVEAAVDGVNQISWRYSYPTSFSYSYRNTFAQMWKAIIEEVVAETGIPLTQGLEKATESIAAARFFKEDPDYKGPFNTGAICIDIGGGTSDLSIWRKNDLVYQTSLRLAGRDIFLDQLISDLGVFELLRLPGVDVEKFDDLNSTQSYAALDAIVKQLMQQDIYKNLSLIADDPQFKRFISNVALGICGILYYAGLMLKRLVQNGQYDASEYLPEIYLAGNGSKLLHWVSMGEYQPDLEISGFFKSVFLNAAELPENRRNNFKIHMSKKPKDEAAAGLVYDATLKSEESWDKDICLAGENFHYLHTDYPWDAELSAEMLSVGIEPRGQEVFNAFIETFNTFAEKAEISKVDNSQENQHKLLRSVHEKYLELTHGDKEQVSVDPIFVVMIKSLLETIRKQQV